MSWNLSEDQAKKDERPGAAMPKGEYSATVFEVTADQSNGVINVQYRIIGPTHENRRMFDNYIPWGPEAPNSNSWWKTKRYLDALGKPVTAGAYTPPSLSDQEGTAINLGIAHQIYDGLDKRSYNDGGKTKDEFNRLKAIIDAGNVEQIPDQKNGGTKDRYTLQERISYLSVAGAVSAAPASAAAAPADDPWAKAATPF